jgi:hypothetical protein
MEVVNGNLILRTMRPGTTVQVRRAAFDQCS